MYQKVLPYFGRRFLRLNDIDMTQYTYIRFLTFTEIMKREKCGLLALPRTVPVGHAVFSVHCAGDSEAKPYADQFMLCKVLGTPRTFL
jgi:hypothetical protein